MIIYLVEPGLNSQPLSLLASFKDFFLVVQFPNFLTTPTGKKPGLHLILWVTTLIKYQITEQTMCKHWFVYKAASMIPQHPALFPSWQPTSSAREPGAPERIQISAYTNWLFQSLESLIIFQITPWSIEAYFFLPGLSLLSTKSLLSSCQQPQSRASTWGGFSGHIRWHTAASMVE